MSALAYYNEHDPEKCAALEAMMADGHIAPGIIDSKDIRDVNPDELSRFTQCHFFAGIGLWSAAARAIGIPDDFPLWSGSCPCQPFSSAGTGEGHADDRHLWPHWFWLIYQRRPFAVVGEQVASKDGLAWLETVSADMEGSEYAGGAIDLCSAGFGSPNIRQRLYMCWLGNASSSGLQGRAFRGSDQENEGRGAWDAGHSGSSDAGRMDNPERAGLERYSGDEHGERERARAAGSNAEASSSCGMACADSGRSQSRRLSEGSGRGWERAPFEQGDGQSGGGSDRGQAGSNVHDQMPAPTNGFWADADWLLCRDPDGEKLRPVRSGSLCLAAGHSTRAAELRAYGDAINLEVAKEFLMAIRPELERIPY